MQKFIKNLKSLITTVLLIAFYPSLLRLPYINIHNHVSRSLKIQPKGKELKQDYTVIDQLAECLQLAWLAYFYSAY